MLVSIYFDELCISLPSKNGSKQKWPNKSNLASMLIRSDRNCENVVDISGATTPCDDGHIYEYRSATLALSRTNRDSRKSCTMVKA